MSFVYFLIAIAAVVAAYLLLFRQSETRELPTERRRPSLPPESPRPPEAERSHKPAPEAEAPPASVRQEVASESAGQAAGAEPVFAPPRELEPAAPEPGESAEPVVAKPSSRSSVFDHEKKVEELRRGLSRSRGEEGLFGRLKALFSGKKQLSSELVAEIEEVLVTSDVGVETTQRLLEAVKASLKKSELNEPDRVWATLREEAKDILSACGPGGGIRLKARPTVVLMVGVNGVGKTTTIGKLAAQLKLEGKKCVLAAGDTFRAAAVQQLVIWGDRVGCEVVHGKDGADPSSVLFDAIRRAEEVGADVVLADTAGRLHTKVNLMAEMKKIAKTAEKALPGAPHEIFLVIDATNGQNALAQAREFKEALPLSGVVLTKLDGTAKGGIVLAIASSLNLPVRFVGLGERLDDLHEFSTENFVEALLGREIIESA